jgi:hypothetical protein
MKQYNYKPRSNSQSSQGSSGQGVAGSPPKEENKMAQAANNAGGAAGGAGGIAQQAGGIAGRRRVSLYLPLSHPHLRQFLRDLHL